MSSKIITAVITAIIVVGTSIYFMTTGTSTLKVGDTDKNGNNALHLAVRNNQYDDFTKLVAEGIDINSKNSHGATAMHFATYSKDPIKSISLLVALGGDINMKNKEGSTPLMYLMSTCKDPKIITQMIGLGADITVIDNEKNTLLHLAAYNKDPRIAQKLVELGLDINAQNKYKLTPLHRATTKKVYNTLLALGANPNIKDYLDTKPSMPAE